MKKTGQYVAAFVASLGGFCAGTSLAWSSPALEHLFAPHNITDNTTVFALSLTEEATVGAMLAVGALFLAIPSGKLSDLWGRKATLHLLSLVCAVSWIVLACSGNALTLIVGRFISGMSLGGFCVVSPMYIGEIADEKNRGFLGSLFTILLGLGLVYTSVIGPFTSWIGLNIGLGIGSVLLGVLLWFIPESPTYLISKNKLNQAKDSLEFLKKDLRLTNDELTNLQSKKSLDSESSGKFTDIFRKSYYRRSLVAGAGVFFLQQSCGINVIVFYTVPIFKASGLLLSPAAASISVNVFSLVCAVLSMFIIDKRGRKFYLIFSSSCMVTGMFGLGAFFQMKETFIVAGFLQALPVISVLLFMGGFSLGFGPVPWILITELYPIEVRGIASGLMCLINWSACFLVTFIYPILMKFIGSFLTFYLYGTVNLFGILFIWFVVPETRNNRIKQ